MNITFRQVEVFLALARTLSFSQAAKDCHISQPALSASIKKMETLLGTQLFDRHTRKVKLTVVGQEFYALATTLDDSMQHSQARIREFIAGERGKLVIAAGPSIAAGYAPRAMAAFLHHYPDIHVQLVDVLSDQCLEMLRIGTADVALTPGFLADREFYQTPLFEDILGAVLPDGHALTQKKLLSWADLKPFPQVVVHATGNLRQTIETEFRRLGLVLSPAYEVAQVGTMLGLIREGLGMGVLSKTLLERFDMNGLTFRPIDSPSAFRTICLMTSASRTQTPAIDAFLKVCIALPRDAADIATDIGQDIDAEA